MSVRLALRASRRHVLGGAWPAPARGFADSLKSFAEDGAVASSSNAKRDLRATGGLGLGDGIKTHTEKWFWGKGPTPMEYILRVEPIANKGSVAACYGGVEPALGHEVEYIKVTGRSKDDPAVCKYCGLRYYEAPGHHGH